MTDHSPLTDHRETGETYRGEVMRLGAYRIAVCRDGRQWLFQRRRTGYTGGGAAWDTLGYAVTRAALERLHRSHTGADAPEIAALPLSLKHEGPA